MAEVSLYYRIADGALVARAAAGGDVTEPELPEGATRLSEGEYQTALADVRAQRQEHAADVAAAEQQSQQADYEALRALNVPEATARRLSGYTSPAPESV